MSGNPAPVPAALLRRRAIDRQWQSRGLCSILLRDAMWMCAGPSYRRHWSGNTERVIIYVVKNRAHGLILAT